MQRIQPSLIYDSSKILSEDDYHLQGTYQCQVREFGSVVTFTSNEILLTYNIERVINGIVIAEFANASQSVYDTVFKRSFMEKIILELSYVRPDDTNRY